MPVHGDHDMNTHTSARRLRSTERNRRMNQAATDALAGGEVMWRTRASAVARSTQVCRLVRSVAFDHAK